MERPTAVKLINIIYPNIFKLELDGGMGKD